MTKNIKILSGILICIIVLFLISQSRQKRHITQTTGIFSILMDEVNKFDIQKDTLFISIQRMDTTWQIIGNDSLLIQMNRVDDIENKILTVKRESIVSNNPNKWRTFNVDDSLGTHLALVDLNQNTIAYYVFGRSTSDYARCYVRKNQDQEVHLVNENLMYFLQTSPQYWGELEKVSLPEENL